MVTNLYLARVQAKRVRSILSNESHWDRNFSLPYPVAELRQNRYETSQEGILFTLCLLWKGVEELD